ncbi:MAG: copper amine oxidase N-terminal domain-containing protein, partial [Firmicutes bacterium]|nr:copper amine oxidase N-terminal domain-containing protein [Bacillota bacterium]
MKRSSKILAIIIMIVFVSSFSVAAIAQEEYAGKGIGRQFAPGQLKKAVGQNEILEDTSGTGEDGEAIEQESSENDGEEKDTVNNLLKGLKNKKQDKKLILKQVRETLRSEGQAGIGVIVKGKLAKFDVPPVVKAGRTLVPFRAITEALGAEVSYDPETMTVTVTKGDIEVILTLGSTIAVVNGEEVEMDTNPELISNRTFVPIRFLSQALGADVEYDPDSDMVVVDDEEEAEEAAQEETVEEETQNEGVEEATQEETVEEETQNEGVEEATQEETVEEGT